MCWLIGVCARLRNTPYSVRVLYSLHFMEMMRTVSPTLVALTPKICRSEFHGSLPDKIRIIQQWRVVNLI